MTFYELLQQCVHSFNAETSESTAVVVMVGRADPVGWPVNAKRYKISHVNERGEIVVMDDEVIGR